MEYVAWPGAVVLIAVAGMLVFRAPVVRLIDRTKSLAFWRGKLDAHPDPPPQPTDVVNTEVKSDPAALAQMNEASMNPLVVEHTAMLTAELKKTGLADADLVTGLTRALSAQMIANTFEAADRSIYASQVAALTVVSQGPRSRADLRPYYDQAAAYWGKAFEHVTFDAWLQFLFNQTLLREDDGVLNITIRGREFLKWRIEVGRGGPYFG